MEKSPFFPNHKNVRYEGDNEDNDGDNNKSQNNNTALEDSSSSWQDRGDTNYLILSDSGKPIFARYGTDEQVSQMCGVLQGLRASVLYETDLQLGDLQSLESDGMRLVVWNVQDLTFVAVCATSDPRGGAVATEAYLRFVLETLYCQLTFSLTKPVLDSILLYPNYEGMMGNTERQLGAILDQLDWQADLDSSLGIVHCLGGGLEPLYPLSSFLRDQASQALREIGDTTPDTLFAIMFGPQGRLVTCVQSAVRALQVRAADITLLLHFVQQQTELLSSELWLPVCLPRFNASGYVYCYTRCLHVDTGLCIGLISHMGTTEQFGLFQQAAARVCTKLSIFPSASNGVTTTNKLSPQRDSDVGSDQDYVDASGDGDRMIPYVAANGVVEEVALAMDEMFLSKLRLQYLQVCQAVHFVFRYNVSLPRSFRQGPGGRLPQCLCVRHPQHFSTPGSRRTLWSTYDKLMMRLRLGSAQSESIQDALSMIAAANQRQQEPPLHAAVDYACHASALLEAAPDFAGMTSVCYGDYLYVGINGEAFELYFTVSNEVSVKQATALGAKLVRRLLMDRQKLFLWNPLVWKP